MLSNSEPWVQPLTWLKKKTDKLEKALTVYFKKPPRTKGGDSVQASVNPRFVAGLRFPVPAIGLNSMRDPGRVPEYFPGYPGITATAFSSFLSKSLASGNRKRWRQTGSRQSTPLSTIRTRYGNSVSTPEATRTLQNPAEFSPNRKPIRNFSIDPTSSIRTRLQTPFLQTPFLHAPTNNKSENGIEKIAYRCTLSSFIPHLNRSEFPGGRASAPDV